MNPHLVLRVVSKLLIPMIVVFGLYVHFHGDYSPGGGFQAGVIVAAAVILYALIFGVDAAKRAVPTWFVKLLAAFGVLLYGGTGVATLLLGANFLDYDVLHPDLAHHSGQHIGIILVELGVLSTVFSVMMAIFYAFAGRAPDIPEGGVVMIELLAERFNFIIVIILMMTGLYAVVATGNLVKRLVGLSLFQTSVFLLYITMGKVFGGQPPILPESSEGHGEAAGYDSAPHAADATIADAGHHVEAAIYSNPLPHVLILTAIVVGVATLAVGLALVVRIRESYGTIEDEAINQADYAVDSAGKNA